jgi:glycosyltransferase involved in cell wall biosynthesis
MLQLLTDFVSVPTQLTLRDGRHVSLLPARSGLDMVRRSRSVDAIVLNGDPTMTFTVVACFALLPCLRKPVIVADLVLRPPRTPRQRFLLPLKRFLFSRVDHFIHFFRDVAGYERHFGITAAKSSYVPFKVNIWGNVAPEREAAGYVFAVGISQRHYDTFIEAVREAGYPAMMTQFSFENVDDRWATLSWPRDQLPPNLTLVSDAGTREDFVRNLTGARIVVIPTRKDSICASGISTYLDAMYLGKCVILARGPGASDVLTDEAIIVEAEDPDELREAIVRAWEDDSYRKGFEQRGHQYAVRLGGEKELIERVVVRAVDWLDSRPGTTES